MLESGSRIDHLLLAQIEGMIVEDMTRDIELTQEQRERIALVSSLDVMAARNVSNASHIIVTVEEDSGMRKKIIPNQDQTTLEEMVEHFHHFVSIQLNRWGYTEEQASPLTEQDMDVLKRFGEVRKQELLREMGVTEEDLLADPQQPPATVDPTLVRKSDQAILAAHFLEGDIGRAKTILAERDSLAEDMPPALKPTQVLPPRR